MAIATDVLPRVSKMVREQVEARVPRQIRRVRGRIARGRARPPIRRVVVVTVASLALASTATAVAFWLSRRFASRAMEDAYEQAKDDAGTRRAKMPDMMEDGATEREWEEQVAPLA